MTGQVSMFGGGSAPAAKIATPSLQPAEIATPAPERPSFGPNVLRVIETKYGPFRRVREGKVVDEYRILELKNGAIVEETTKGERRAADLCGGSGSREAADKARALINASLDTGLWKELRP